MANAVVPWDQRPEYLTYTDWTPIPGVTSYVVPRNGSGTDVTQFHPGQAFLSEQNLPDIMYQLHPCEEWKRFKTSPGPGPKHNPDGSLVYEQWTRPGCDPQPLRDFKVLPDKISSQEAWWYHEFVRRMDPRIRQRDIVMREGASAERLRMDDQRYINLHLNTPGYRNYRPAWNMISWHRTRGSEAENKREQSVLDRLTDAQKNANTTRGSTPGLINPTLGDVFGNRIALPSVVLKKRGPRRRAGNSKNTPATQLEQPAQALPVPQAPQDQNGYQNQQFPQSARAIRHDAMTPPLLDPSTTIEMPSQNLAGVAGGPNDLEESEHAQASVTTVMPSSSLPYDPQDSLPPPRRETSLHQYPPQLTDWPLGVDNTQIDSLEVEGVRATDHQMPERQYPFMSDEDIATMSAKSDKAMAEIHWMCEPFLGTGSDLQGPPPMDLSSELIEDLGMSFMFPTPGHGKAREEENPHARPSTEQTEEARDSVQRITPMLPEKQNKKRKELEDEDENFQQVQLDVERKEQRPIKRVKSVHHATFQNSDTETLNVQQQHFPPQLDDHQLKYSPGQGSGEPFPQEIEAPQVENYQFGFSQGQVFGEPTLQDIGPPQLNDNQSGSQLQDFGGPILQDIGAPYMENFPLVYSEGQDSSQDMGEFQFDDSQLGYNPGQGFDGSLLQDIGPVPLENHQLGYNQLQDFSTPTVQDIGAPYLENFPLVYSEGQDSSQDMGEFQFDDSQLGYNPGQGFDGSLLQDIGPVPLENHQLGYNQLQDFSTPTVQDIGALYLENFPLVYSQGQDSSQDMGAFQFEDNQLGYDPGQGFGGFLLQDIGPIPLETHQLGYSQVQDIGPLRNDSEPTYLYAVDCLYDQQNEAMIGQHPNQTIGPSQFQYNPETPVSSSSHDHQPSAGWSYIRAPIEDAQVSDFQPLESTETFFHGDIPAAETSTGPSAISLGMPNVQTPNPQPTAPSPISRVDRGKNRYHPYSSSNKGKAQRTEASRVQQFEDSYPAQAEITLEAPVHDGHALNTPSTSLGHTPPTSDVPDFTLDPYLEGAPIYKNDDPGQGLDIEAMRKFQDWLTRG